jgi:2-keto-3-deoxy-6-phosphogluconate aldolase
MQPPDAFLEFTAYFHQDLFAVYPSIEEAMRDAGSFLTPNQLAEVKAFLDKLIAGPYTNEELVSIWEKSRSEIRVMRGNMREFLREARSYL